MEIEIKNLGKIKKGQFDLSKKINVFVGYNNSGKTYFSQLLWSLYSSSVLIDKTLPNLDFNIGDADNYLIVEDSINLIVKNYKKYTKTTVLPYLFNVDSDYPLFRDFSIEFTADFINEIKHKSYNHLEINVDKRDPNNTPNYLEYTVYKKDTDSLKIKIKHIHLEESISFNDIWTKEGGFNNISICRSTETKNTIGNRAITSIITNLCFQQNYTPIFLPANREFFPSFYKYIYSVAKEEKDLIDERLKQKSNKEGSPSIKALSKRPYSKAADDLIQKVYDLNKNKAQNNNKNAHLLSDLKEIIGGDIVIKSSEGIAPVEFFLQIDTEKEIDMYMSSSSVNQLTILYLYFKYWAQPANNFLIFDEPEISLHPENQIKLVALLMKFANENNNKVLLTTHSPLIAELVNNYANMAFLRSKGEDVDSLFTNTKMKLTNIMNNLNHNDFGIYFFDGKNVKNYEIGDYGVYFKDFQETQDKIRETSSILRDKIYDKLNPNTDAS